MPISRYLKYALPMLKGNDVLELQQCLINQGYGGNGEPDGIFGIHTENAVLQFQSDHALTVDGVVGQQTWNALNQELPEQNHRDLQAVMSQLNIFHGFRDSIGWRLTDKGVEIKNSGIERTSGKPKTVSGIWKKFGDSITLWSGKFGVPAELIVATIATESGGNPAAVREEPGYQSDNQTPNKVSPGLMQTLISTARQSLGDDSISREWLLEPGNSIKAGTSYIAAQWKQTEFDPPKVACAYNAGGIYPNTGAENRWKMRQYPIGTGKHADRFVKLYNDFCAFAEDESLVIPTSFRAVSPS